MIADQYPPGRVEVDGRPGMLALPPGPAPAGGWPAVACFGGSEGGYESQIATVGFLASHGYAALAATWVDTADGARARGDAPDERPSTDVIIADVPLERFGLAVGRLADHDEVDADPIVAMGISRGAEGLLAAACAPTGLPVCGLALLSPSSVAWQAVGPAGEIPDTASWTLAGAPVPWSPLPSGALMPQIIRNAWRVDRDVRAHRPSLLRLRPAYEAAGGIAFGGNRAAQADADRRAATAVLAFLRTTARVGLRSL